MGRRSFVLGCLVTSSLLVFGITAPASAASKYANTDYVALGDSYSSGVGAPGQLGLCLRSPNGYPGQWVSRNQPKSYVNLACSGAVTSDVVNYQLPFVTSRADLVSITIGGNDAGFASTVISCTISSDAACLQTIADARSTITTTLAAKLDTTYAGIRRKAPNAQVVVLGYPLLYDTSSASCGVGGMSLAKRRALNEGAQILDDLIQQRAAAAGFTYSDVRDEFAGHGICAASPYLNGLTVLPPTNSFHPNKSGYTYGYLPALSAAAG
jgi:lysophospholipase L1-like esterase